IISFLESRDSFLSQFVALVITIHNPLSYSSISPGSIKLDDNFPGKTGTLHTERKTGIKLFILQGKPDR
ncbi:hypothetical protein K8S19_04540, partial [bacterium]|nr:hypothetical protein [bacterium]